MKKLALIISLLAIPTIASAYHGVNANDNDHESWECDNGLWLWSEDHRTGSYSFAGRSVDADGYMLNGLTREWWGGTWEVKLRSNGSGSMTKYVTAATNKIDHVDYFNCKPAFEFSGSDDLSN